MNVQFALRETVHSYCAAKIKRRDSPKLSASFLSIIYLLLMPSTLTSVCQMTYLFPGAIQIPQVVLCFKTDSSFMLCFLEFDRQQQS